MTTITTADRYGEAYALDLAMYSEIYNKVHWFSDMHPLLIPNPNEVQPADGPRFMIRNPEKHTLKRDGDWMYCIECNEACETGTIPRRPLTAMEASLSRFD